MEETAVFHPVGWRRQDLQRTAVFRAGRAMDMAEIAWVVQAHVGGRSQVSIAEELGVSPSAINVRIMRFCEHHGYAVQRRMIYNEERREAAFKALMQYRGEVTKPTRRPWGQETPFTPAELAAARREHAWLLRAEGFKYREIGERLGGVSVTRASQLVAQQGRRVSRAMRRIRWSQP